MSVHIFNVLYSVNKLYITLQSGREDLYTTHDSTYAKWDSYINDATYIFNNAYIRMV